MDSETAVDALFDVDPGFAQMCETLLGDVADPREVWDYLYGREPVVKMSPSSSDVSTRGGIGGRAARFAGRAVKTRKGKLVAAAATYVAGVGSGIGVSNVPRGSSQEWGYSIASKADDGLDVTWSGEFSKVDSDKREVFGWASVVELDGKPVVDRQGDLISPDEIERAAYQYVMKSRKGGHQHRRDGEHPFHASDMIESVVFTPEKISKMGLPDSFPVGWWVGYKVNDDSTWALVKKGDVTGFSIHGKGKRQAVDI